MAPVSFTKGKSKPSPLKVTAEGTLDAVRTRGSSGRDRPTQSVERLPQADGEACDTGRSQLRFALTTSAENIHRDRTEGSPGEEMDTSSQWSPNTAGRRETDLIEGTNASDETLRAPGIGIYEGEDQLEHDHTESEWREFEKRFKTTDMRISFSIDEPTILVPERGYWGLQELATSIVQVCGSKGVWFASPGLQPVDGQMTLLLGRPKVQDRNLWRFLRRGYVKVHGATIWVAPQFTGRSQSNLDLIEIEYSNANYLSAHDLRKVLREWGALEALVVSHGASRLRQGKWPSIACITNAVIDPATGEPKFAFRLCFECPATANTVYQSFLDRDTTAEQRVEDGRTIRLTPVQRVEWCSERGQMIRPSAASELENLSRRLHVFGVNPEIGCEQIQDKLASLGYDGATVSIQPGRWWGTITLQDTQSADRLCEAYGVHQKRRIFLGNIRLFVNKPGEDGGLRCFRCGVSGHFRRECRQETGATTQADHRHTFTEGPEYSRGRANSHWQAIAAAARNSGGRVLGERGRTTGRRRDGRGETQVVVDQRTLLQQYEPMMRSLIADQVRAQSQTIVRDVQIELRRHSQAVDERLHRHDTAIQRMQATQEATTSEVHGIAALLGRMAAHLKVPDFSNGSPAGGAGSQ